MPKRGDVREDGLVFMKMKRGKEYWARPEILAEERKQAAAKYWLDPQRAKDRAHIRWEKIKDNEDVKAAAREKSRKWRAKNRDKMRIAISAWEQRNPDKVKEAKLKWVKKNPEKVKEIRISSESRRRARKAMVDDGVTLAEMTAIKSAAKGKCHYCGNKHKRLQFDHIVSIAKGGRHCKSNLVMACPTCNSSKNDKDPIAYAAKIGRLLI